MRRGQVSMEYLLVMGFSFLLLAPLLVFYATQSVDAQSSIENAQATQAATKLINSAERVYYSGMPAFETVTVRIPVGVRAFEVTNSSVYFDLRGSDVPVFSNVPLVPTNFPTGAGLQSFRVSATISGVEITEV